jgi:hypothetical protein
MLMLSLSARGETVTPLQVAAKIPESLYQRYFVIASVSV